MTTFLHLLLSTFGLLGAHDPGTVGIAVAVIAVAVLALTVVTVGVPGAVGTSAPHPRRAIDVSTLLFQSDPDASGHPRPRAPQRAASAA